MFSKRIISMLVVLSFISQALVVVDTDSYSSVVVEDYSILEMARQLSTQSGKKLTLSFNGELDGQFRKDGNNRRLKEIIGSFEFTKFKDGIIKTYEWYLENINE